MANFSERLSVTTPITSFINFVFLIVVLSGSVCAVNVDIANPFKVVILFQRVTLQCSYQTSATIPPIVTWRYKSFCKDRVSSALSPSSQGTAVQQNVPGSNPYVECQDTARTVRIVATKQGSTVTLGEFYHGRQITITGRKTSNATDLLPGLQIGELEDWLFVVLVVLAFLLLLLLIGICWCQCCPHTCCCYVRCPCCPEKCCCPRALYEAGKAATSGVPSIYAPSVYAPSVYSHPSQAKLQPNPIPLLPVQAMQPHYMPEYDRASSVGHSSQVPLLQDQDANSVRSGYRIQANQQDDSMRVLYYMEKELANFDPTRPGDSSGKYEKLSAMSELSSLHEDGDPRNLRNGIGRLRNQGMPPIRDVEEESMISSASRSRPQPSRNMDYYEDRNRRNPDYDMRPRAHSMDNLDDLDRFHDYNWDRRGEDRSRGRRPSDDDTSSRGYNRERHRRDYSPDSRDLYQRRSRSRDDLRNLDYTRSPAGSSHGAYDDSFLQEVLRKKQRAAGNRDIIETSSNVTSRSGNRRNAQEDDFPPPPPPYIENESVSSRGRNDKKIKRNEAVSRDSLVV
ncbi:lipolysis-stimulated lipoprotein receptor [Protopterus annectens]|uniref:lipolysis-stimulated lipoprotein receptor n=1 Tax=Protopterus annectens TaxID=7888 RepID=UPI001CF9E13C|nr:lipolysis-stimulated lipoprotein receptor [Protopterus annectens]